MRVPLSWAREFAELPGDPTSVADRLAACGFELAAIDGEVIDVEVPANRADCLSVYGLAREAATAFDVPLAQTPGAEAAGVSTGDAAIAVSIDDAGCARYALATVDLTVAPSPGWLTERLIAAGVRPINNVVDVTNYVMLETGHPTHAFDAATLTGPEIRVRRARAGERLVTLDGQDRSLDGRMLVIADRDRPVALAGVMGGAGSEVSPSTSRIALESAWFEPAAVRATGRLLGLKTEASARFERGADIEAPVRAIRRALALLARLGVARSGAGITDLYPRRPEPVRVRLRRDRIAHLLGQAVDDTDVERILRRLEFGLSPAEDGWLVEVPSHRVDVRREADLIEEVGRHWGFDRIPATFPPLTAPPERPLAPTVERDRRLRTLLCGAGLQEAVTFTFIEAAAAAPFTQANGALTIANPLSEKFAVLRPSLLPGLLDALVYNRHRQADDVRLFEIGSVFDAQGERRRVGWILAGSRVTHWSAASDAVDFFDAKGIGELFGDVLHAPIVTSAAADRPWFVPGRAANILVQRADGLVAIGNVGQLQPDIVAARGLAHGGAVYGGEIELTPPRQQADSDDVRRTASLPPAALDGFAPATTIAPLPRYPSVVRDVSILVDERLPAAEVRGTIRANAPATLVDVREFDRYQGRGVPDGQISLSLRLTFRAADRTLTDAEVQHAFDRIVAALAAEHGAKLR